MRDSRMKRPRRSPRSSKPSTTSTPISSSNLLRPERRCPNAESLLPGSVSSVRWGSAFPKHGQASWPENPASPGSLALMPRPFASQIAGEVKGFDVGKYLPVKEARRFDVFIHYGMAAAIEAIKDSGHRSRARRNAERIGVNIGSGIGGLPMIEEAHTTLLEQRAAQDLAVLHSRHHHQHDLGKPVDHVRVQGTEPGDHHGVHHARRIASASRRV